MKKIILTLLATAALLMTSIAVSADYSDVPADTNEARILGILDDLEIMVGYDEDGVRTFKPDQPITRAEFVTTIHNAVKLWNNVSGGAGGSGFDWNAFFYGDAAMGTELYIPPVEGEEGENTVRTSFWLDVEEDYWAYQYMKTVATFGHVVGYPDKTFRPDNTITYNEAITVILNIAGYKEYALARGGFPDGYNQYASRFELSKGLYATGDRALSRMDAASLIYNAFNIKMAPTEVDENDEGRTFLNDIVDVYIVEGTLSYTDITSLYDDEGIKDNQATVGNTTFSFDKDDTEVRDYIGQELRVYLSRDSENSDKFVLKTFETTGKDDITVVDADLYEEFSNNTLKYTKDKDSDTIKSVKVKSGSVLIYNGKYKTGEYASIFESINKGTITVISKKSLDFDVIVVEDFNTGYIESVSATYMEIYDRLAEGTDYSVIELAPSGEKTIYQLMNADGEAIEINDMKKGAVNYYVNDGYIKLYYTESTAEGYLTVERDDDETYYKVDDERYKVSETYKNFIGGTLRGNFEGSVVLDRYNEVVWMSDSIDASGYAYIIKSKYDAENDTLLVTYYDIDSSSVKERVATAEEVRYSDKTGKTSKLTSTVLEQELAECEDLVKIVLNDNGEIRRITLPVAQNNTTSNALKIVYDTTTMQTKPYYNANSEGKNTSFGNEMYLDTTTVVVRVPIDESVYTDYKKLTNASLSWGQYNAKCYSFDANSPYAKFVLVWASSSATNVFERETTIPCLVTNIADSINADGELAREVTLFNGSGFITVYGEEDESNGYSTEKGSYKSVFETASDGASLTNKIYTVEVGDVIQYATDDVSGKVLAVRILYDANAINPAWCQGAELTSSDPPVKCTENHVHTTTKGHLLGMTGFYGNGDYTPTKSNPFWYDGSTVKRATFPSSGGQTYMLGYIYQNNQGLYEITTQNLADGFVEKNKAEFKWQYADFDSGSPTVYIVGDDYSVSTGNMSMIRTYMQAGKNADKCLFTSMGGISKVTIWVMPD